MMVRLVPPGTVIRQWLNLTQLHVWLKLLLNFYLIKILIQIGVTEALRGASNEHVLGNLNKTWAALIKSTIISIYISLKIPLQVCFHVTDGGIEKEGLGARDREERCVFSVLNNTALDVIVGVGGGPGIIQLKSFCI